MALTLNQVPATVWIVVLIGIMLGVGGIVFAEFLTQIQATVADGENSTTYAMVNDTLQATTTFSDWMPIIILVIVIGIVITILISALAFGGRR